MAEKNLPVEGFNLVYKEQPIAVQNQHPATFTNPDYWTTLLADHI